MKGTRMRRRRIIDCTYPVEERIRIVPVNDEVRELWTTLFSPPYWDLLLSNQRAELLRIKRIIEMGYSIRASSVDWMKHIRRMLRCACR